MHSHVVSVGARLASVDPLSTSFLLPNQVISEEKEVFEVLVFFGLANTLST